MSIEHHYLKTQTKFYQAVENGIKKFELRLNDRNFKIGDMIYLEETVNGFYTGRKLDPMEIKYILHGTKFGLKENFCIICW
jgi:Domain of unknown function (DUF3850)